ncbi:ATP (CTP):tRNA-specific tRNA nucleotidyltransferase [Komagataella phaffii CBS 7435]|uniref:CCA tRNA nucleotidyltransferase, mitochondrial n=2 Tax=Komagataella phaffii TaxID=460519 RepID=C4QZV9_KOMPG|nr:ATP (CTP):tRNA-specific tRNA nucleotidyltransferase [Komagataella phaffii GS115]CAH2448719.1 ATP (CTP)tRNA-specific tRNA nucleotidyltransferase [Komagataella phaffii CBS 7435]CAY68783.1 ATP (CTP):tRNA-specific tRNA nucleotidyltransferase [Komagataella phaffii GS115]CCA38810.1 ATP (CTP):tRNA-specific tRNA nucleotidyltransferase [Komagataella phaffii CBS 7435]
MFRFVRSMSSQLSSIKLDDKESQICSLLKYFCNHYNTKLRKPNEPDLQLRITGGWVRDKLLGRSSHDIDIAINTLSGESFAEKLVSFIKENHKDEIESILSSSIHKINKNPDKSKHLETCTTKLYGIDIDFVNLRNEKYTEESRIPTIDYGTPQEDALRRDATLNALFYNLTTDQIEDFTEKGLIDLKQGVLRTPLEPSKTFLDDPLRCLRLIRFASVFGFSVSEDALQAMKQPKIKEALNAKISRERIGVEIDKILVSKDPIRGLKILRDTNLLDAIFNFGDLQDAVYELNPKVRERLNQVFTIYLPESASKISSLPQLIQQFPDDLKSVYSQLDLRVLYLNLLLYPFAQLRLKFSTKPTKNTRYATEMIVRDGLKYSSKDSDTVSLIVDNYQEFQHLVQRDVSTLPRSVLGMAIRKYNGQWELNLIICLLLSIFEGADSNAIEKYHSTYQHIKNQDLSQVHSLRPLVDGKTLCKELGKKPGPWMKPLMDKLLVWQLDHPTEDSASYISRAKTVLDETL